MKGMQNQSDYLSVKPHAHVGILGGSFDPPHLSHALLALSFLALEKIDELWIIPCANHAFKRDLTNFEDRMRMCEIAFQRINHVRVLDLENKLSGPSYTIKTVETILTHRPDLKILLGIGSDLVPEFSTWHRAAELTARASIVIFERKPFTISSLPKELQTARIHAGYALPDVASTSIRDIFQRGQLRDCNFLDHSVVEYIKAHRIYDARQN